MKGPLLGLNNRVELARCARGVGVEVGVAEGLYSATLLDVGKLTKLYSVDPWDATFAGYPNQAHADKDYAAACKTLAAYGARSEVVRDPGRTVC